MRFGKFEIPPVFRGKKEEEEESHPTFERAPQPAPLNIDGLMTLAAAGDEDAFEDALNNYITGWNEYATTRNVYLNNGTAPMWEAARQARKLVRALGSEQGREQTKESLHDLLNALNGELPDALIEKVTAHEDRINETTAHVQERRTGEAHTELERAVGEVESLGSGEPLSMMEILRRQAAEHPEQFLAADSWLKENDDEKAVEDADEKPQGESEETFELKPDMEVPVTQSDANDDILELTPEMRARKIDEARERVAPQQEAMRAAEEAYLREYKNYYRKLGAREGKEPESLKELLRDYNESRFAYREALDSSAFDRIQAKVTNGELSADVGNRLLERYNRIVTYREVIKPAAEKRYEARLEAQGESAVGMFKKGLGWLAEKNQRMERWLEEKTGSKHAARFTRAVGTTIVIGATAGAAGSFGAAGLMAAAGWGTMRVMRSIGSSIAGGFLGELAAEGFGAFKRGRMEAAAEELREQTEQARAWTAFDSIDDFEVYDRERQRLLGATDERKLEQQKMLVRALTALGVGAGTSAFLSHLPSGLGTIAEGSAPAPTHGEASPAVPQPMSSPESHTVPAPEHHAAPQAMEKAAPVHQPAHAPHAAPRAEHAAPAPSPSVEQPPAPIPAPEPAASSYDGPFKEVIPLPEGIDPESPEAVAYLNHVYNPSAFEAETTSPAPEASAADSASTPEAATPEVAPAETPSPEVHEPQAQAIPEAAAADDAPDVAPEPTPDPAEATVPPHASPEVPAEPAAPEHVGPQASESAPVEAHEQTIEVTGERPSSEIALEAQAPDHPFTNVHGLEIDPREPHVYAIKGLEGGGVLWGGSGEQRSEFVTQFYSDPANQQTILYVPAIDPAGDPMKTEILAYQADESGTPKPVPVPAGKKQIVKFSSVDLFTDILM